MCATAAALPKLTQIMRARPNNVANLAICPIFNIFECRACGLSHIEPALFATKSRSVFT
jgi:hypothetical protein